MTDFAQRRTMMVDSQVRPNEVTSYPVIEAMLTVPREQFVPDSRQDVAYAENNIDLAPGRVLLEPRTLGKMMDVLDLQNSDLVLDIGPGYGYAAALMARIVEAAADKHPDILFAKVNTEEEQALASAFGIRSIPTLMVFREQIMLFQQAGALPANGLEQLIGQVRSVDMDEVRRQIEAEKPGQ